MLTETLKTNISEFILMLKIKNSFKKNMACANSDIVLIWDICLCGIWYLALFAQYTEELILYPAEKH